jgi:hypothetical protein
MKGVVEGEEGLTKAGALTAAGAGACLYLDPILCAHTVTHLALPPLLQHLLLRAPHVLLLVVHLVLLTAEPKQRTRGLRGAARADRPGGAGPGEGGRGVEIGMRGG